MTTLVLGSLLLGWLIGGLANWAADQLPYVENTDNGIRTTPWAHPLRYWWWPAQRAPAHATPQTDAADDIADKTAKTPAPRPWRTPLLLVATALCFAYTAYRIVPFGSLDWSLRQVGPLLLAWAYVAFFLVVLVIDLEHRRVLNIMLLPAVGVALLGSLLPGTPSLPGALLGGAVGFGLFLLVHIVGRGRMGAGDVKLAGVIGLMVGHPAVWTALVIGIILGGVAAIILLASRSATLRSTMAYAPYLAIGALIALWQTWGFTGGL